MKDSRKGGKMLKGKEAIGKIKVGWWFAPCCLEDLQQIKTKKDLREQLEDIEIDHPLAQMTQFWPDKKSAIKDLKAQEANVVDEFDGVRIIKIDVDKKAKGKK